MPLRLGDGLPSSTVGSTANSFLSLTNVTPVGGTPTAATFLGLTSTLPNLTGHTFAILATDGGPNCNDALTCGADQCTANIDMLKTATCGGMPGNLPCAPGGPNCCSPSCILPSGTFMPQQNCLDGPRTVAAVAALAAKGVPTFAIGVPGSDLYRGILDQIAMAGGTSRASEPYYYRVNTANENELVDALDNIAARIAASCAIELKHAPQPNETNLVVNGHLVPQSGTNGWSVGGTFVTLFGETCTQVRTLGEKVIVTEGCATLVK